MKKIITLSLLTCLAAMAAQAGMADKLASLKSASPQSVISVTAEGTVVTPPEGIEPALYTFKGHDTYIDRDKESQVFVVIDNNDVYIQGLSVDYLPDAWVKGNLAEGKVTFAAAYMGSFEFWGDTYLLDFDGATFDYNADANTFTAVDGYTTSSEGEVLDEYVNVVLTGAVATPATPAMPEITVFETDKYGSYIKMTVPLKDVDGNDLFAALLSYQILYDKGGQTGVFEFTSDAYEFLGTDAMTTIPYNFTDSYDIDKGGKQIYIYADDLSEWSAIGAKSVYTVGDVSNESETFWYELGNTGINDIASDAVAHTRYYDLQGRQVESNTSGLIIKQVQMPTGTIRTQKILNK